MATHSENMNFEFVDENTKENLENLKKNIDILRSDDVIMTDLLNLELENETLKHSILLKTNFLKSTNKIFVIIPKSGNNIMYGEATKIFDIINISGNTNYEKWKNNFNGKCEVQLGFPLTRRLELNGYKCAFSNNDVYDKKMYWFK